MNEKDLENDPSKILELRRKMKEKSSRKNKTITTSLKVKY
jgi:hypothetical protein